VVVYFAYALISLLFLLFSDFPILVDFLHFTDVCTVYLAFLIDNSSSARDARLPLAWVPVCDGRQVTHLALLQVVSPW